MIHAPSFTALSVVALTIGLAAPATAQQAQGVTLEGSADRLCVLSAPELGAGPLENFSVPTGNVYSVEQLADPNTLTTRAARMTLSMAAMCNGVHRLVVTSENSGLWRQGTPSSAVGFGTGVPYRLNLAWADENPSLNADASIRQARQWLVLVGRPNAGAIELEFEIDAGATNAGTGAPMVAGAYADVLTLTVESQ